MRVTVRSVSGQMSGRFLHQRCRQSSGLMPMINCESISPSISYMSCWESCAGGVVCRALRINRTLQRGATSLIIICRPARIRSRRMS